MSRKTQTRLSSFFLICFILLVIFIISIILLPSFICSPSESFIYNNKKRDVPSNPNNSLKFSLSQEPENLSTANGFCKLFQTLSDYYGKTDSYIVDPQSKYYSDVSNVINQSKDIVLKKAKDLKEQGFTPLIMSDLDDTLWCTFNESKNSLGNSKIA